jgi:hypothetical protein
VDGSRVTDDEDSAARWILSASEGSMDVRITFSGLCLFVPRPGATNTVSVLLPKTGDAVHRHRPALLFDMGYMFPTPQLTGQYTHVTLQSRLLSFGNGSGASLTLCDEIVNIYSVLGGANPLSALGSEVVSIVTLSSGSMTSVASGACWSWQSAPSRRMAHRARWTLTDPNDTYTVTVVAPGDSQSTVSTTLQPVGGFLDLQVLHLPADDFPPDPPMPPTPAPNATPDHFAAYFRLFDSPVTAQYPGFVSASDDCGPKTCLHTDDAGASAFNCMLAKVSA